MSHDEMRELYTLRTEKLWSWWELAERYHITCDEARRAYAEWSRNH